MQYFLEYLQQQRENNYSDTHLLCGTFPCFRDANGLINKFNTHILSSEKINQLVNFLLTDKEKDKLRQTGSIIISKNFDKIGRYRVSIFYQTNGYGCIFRLIPNKLPHIQDLDMPSPIINLLTQTHGIILITGPNNSGKTTILNSIIDKINTNETKNIITLEDPIEYVHRMKKSLVVQREIGKHTLSYIDGMRDILKQDADMVFISEIKNHESMDMVIQLCESGYLVITSLHATDTKQSIERIIKMYPPEYQNTIQKHLSLILKGVMCQELIRNKDKLIPCREILIPDESIKLLLESGDLKGIHNEIKTSHQSGNILFDEYLLALYKKGDIDKDIFEKRVHNIKDIENMI